MRSERLSRSTVRPELEPRSQTTRFGLIALATDLTSEGDFARTFPPGTALHTTRVAYENPTTPENLRKMAPRLTAAAALLVPSQDLAAICYSCTAASATIGDEEVRRAIGEGRADVPVVTPTGAARKGLEALGARRIAMLTPYLEETSAPVADFFEANGFGVERLHCFGMEDDREMARVSPASLVSAALQLNGPDVDAIFISCTALPAIRAIAEIESQTGKPVVTSNQASAWMMLRLAGFASWKPEGLGGLFECDLPSEDTGAAA